MSYIRTNIYLSPKQREGLKKTAKAKDIKVAEAVRTAINEWLRRNQDA